MPAPNNSNLQVRVSEGNTDRQLIPGQQSPETIDVLAHVPQLSPVSKARATTAGPRRTFHDFLLELFAGIATS